jgi:hypothetical protein
MFSMEPAFSSCTNPEARTRASARLFGVRPSDEACLTGSFEFQRLLVWVWTRNGRSRRSEKRHGDLLRGHVRVCRRPTGRQTIRNRRYILADTRFRYPKNYPAP